MPLTLWERAKLEQLTRRGEMSHAPARVQRLTDTLHLCRVAGESAEIAIRAALDAMTPGCVDTLTDWTVKTPDVDTARAILRSWILQHGQTDAGTSTSPGSVLPGLRAASPVPAEVPTDPQRHPLPHQQGRVRAGRAGDPSPSQWAEMIAARTRRQSEFRAAGVTFPDAAARWPGTPEARGATFHAPGSIRAREVGGRDGETWGVIISSIGAPIFRYCPCPWCVDYRIMAGIADTRRGEDRR